MSKAPTDVDAVDRTRHIEFLPLADLKFDPANPKAHSLSTIGDSIARLGYVEPVVIDERTGYLVAGHGRTNALRERHEAGQAAPEGVRTSGEDGVDDWLVPVVRGWASKNDAEAHAALIALNRTTELGGWVDDALLHLLDELSTVDGGFVGTGMDGDDLDDLRARLAGPPDLDDLVAKWEAQDNDKAGPGRVVIALDGDTAVALAWVAHREGFKDDPTALAALLLP